MTIIDTSHALTLVLGIMLGAIFVMLTLGVNVTEDGKMKLYLSLRT